MARFKYTNILKYLQELKDAGWKAFLDDLDNLRLEPPHPIGEIVKCFCPITAIAAYKGSPIVEVDDWEEAARAMRFNLDKADRVVDAADEPFESDGIEVKRLRIKMLKVFDLSEA